MDGSSYVLLQNQKCSGKTGGQTFQNNSEQYVYYLSNMLHGEPIISSGLNLLKANIFRLAYIFSVFRCYEINSMYAHRKEIRCLINEKPCSDAFKNFINQYYVPFAKDVSIFLFFSSIHFI